MIEIIEEDREEGRQRAISALKTILNHLESNPDARMILTAAVLNHEGNGNYEYGLMIRPDFHTYMAYTEVATKTALTIREAIKKSP